MPRRVFLLILIVLTAFGAGVAADQKGPSEYQVKAACLYNFAKFVEWPSRSFTDETTLEIVILGENPFGDELRQMVEGKTAGQRALSIRFIEDTSEIDSCQILFICSSEADGLDDILKSLRDRPTLTVSDLEGFTETGGMIGFFMLDRKVRFEINLEVARQAKLEVSSKLLQVARVSAQAEQEENR